MPAVLSRYTPPPSLNAPWPLGTLVNVDAEVDKEALSINALAVKGHVNKKFLHPHSLSVVNNGGVASGSGGVVRGSVGVVRVEGGGGVGVVVGGA
jgi:hypothetical protein